MPMMNSSYATAPALVARQPSLLFYGRQIASLLRFSQWLKNGFVFAPFLFAGRLVARESVWLSLWTFLSFGFLSSAVYVLNDWMDCEKDRLHPRKRLRPIASGAIPLWAAALLGVSLLASALALAYVKVNLAVVGFELTYLALNLGYSLLWKHIVIVDVFSIAAGFVLRVWAGAYAISVPASHWLILCTFLLALFLALTKRQSELVKLAAPALTKTAIDQTTVIQRPVLNFYSSALISQMNLVVCSSAVVCYALYTVSPETIDKFGTDRLVYSVPFVIYGLFRYLFLSEMRREGENPSSLVVHDRPLLICVAAWVLFCTGIVYGYGRL